MGNRQRITADILIIGGGSAGSMAAIRAKEIAPDLQVAIFEKGDLRRGGTIAMGMDAMNNVVVPGVTTEDEYLEAVSLMTERICDPDPHRVIARRGSAMLQKLECWGVKTAHRPDGSYVVNQKHPKGRLTVPIMLPTSRWCWPAKLSSRECGC